MPKKQTKPATIDYSGTSDKSLAYIAAQAKEPHQKRSALAELKRRGEAAKAAEAATILAIAQKYLLVETLETQNSSADFREQATWTLKAALEAAFAAGKAAK